MELIVMKASYCLGWAVWLMVASINNATDRGTNTLLLQRMFGMSELREDGLLGQGLLWRAFESGTFCRWVLRAVIGCHLSVAAALLYAAWLFASGAPAADAMAAGTLAFTAFCGVWFSFLTGGLWFGYWIKMPQVQQVHLSLLILGSLGLLLMSIH